MLVSVMGNEIVPVREFDSWKAYCPISRMEVGKWRVVSKGQREKANDPMRVIEVGNDANCNDVAKKVSSEISRREVGISINLSDWHA